VTKGHGQDWLVVSVSTAGAAGTLRVQVWRKLRSLGAVYLQQSVCLLPARDEVVRQMRRLTDRIRHQGGTARVLQMRFTNPAEEQSMVEEFNAARDSEYSEMLERIPALREELAQERARGRATYAEVEESEADLERFRAWLAKIAARDYFAAPVGQAARAAIDDAAADLAAFEQLALQADAAANPTPAPDRKRLRVVEES
jgi:hypothetical protein